MERRRNRFYPHMSPNHRFHHRPPSLSKSRSSEKHSVLPAEVSQALAALRCLPCLVGSSAATEGVRREAVGRPLGLIEDLLAACSASSGVAAAAIKRASSTIQTKKLDTAADGASERGRKRGKGEGGKATDAVEDARGGDGGGDQTDARDCNTHNEVVVLQAYALEAGVGLCCLLPADQSGMGREETLERLLRWHER